MPGLPRPPNPPRLPRLPLDLIERLRRSRWTLPLAALAALVLMVINEAAYERSTLALGRLAERAAARAQIERVWRGLTEAESGQRGYLLAARPEYLRPYEASVGEVQAALAWLLRHYGADPELGPVVAELQAHAGAKLSEMAATLDLQRRGRGDASRELLLTDIGRERMEGVRAAAQRLLAVETRRVDAERQAVMRTLDSGRIGVDLMTVLSLLGLVLFLRQTVAFDRAQRRHADAVQAERDRLEAEVARRTADLTRLARHLQTAREDERSRLARELHDELGALLTAAKLDAARLKRVLEPLSPDAAARLAHLNESINRGIELKRRIIEDLHPSSLTNLGLVAALEILLREQASRGDWQLHTEIDPAAAELPLAPQADITVYRLVQEALTNIVKHAAARHVTVALRPDARPGRPGLQVVVHDDGRGFDPEARPGATHGLMGMRYRVEAENGEMHLHTRPGEGTRIEAWLPLAAPPAAAAAPSEGSDSRPAPLPTTPCARPRCRPGAPLATVGDFHPRPRRKAPR